MLKCCWIWPNNPRPKDAIWENWDHIVKREKVNDSRQERPDYNESREELVLHIGRCAIDAGRALCPDVKRPCHRIKFCMTL